MIKVRNSKNTIRCCYFEFSYFVVYSSFGVNLRRMDLYFGACFLELISGYSCSGGQQLPSSTEGKNLTLKGLQPGRAHLTQLYK